ncbi:MAG: serine protease [Anaerolineales bacterium]
MPINLSMGEMIPTQVVLPLVSVNDKGKFSGFIGTGFFVGDESLFVTAAHNVEAEGVQFGVIYVENLERIFPASVRYVDKLSDVAILEVVGYRPEKRLALSSGDDIYLNLPVYSLEYGTTVIRGRDVRFSPASRIGNVIRSFSKLELLGRELVDALEISFPALRGASGAPVLTNDGFMVIGMLVGNMSYHLLPAQIETATDENGQVIEEIKYMLPVAVAAHVNSIRQAIEKVLNNKKVS